ncbi:YceI family protein [Psychroserpens ponticola]|uniref:YceI family protein n=1 Tax=Psychroserpens ponticola TaxID=2932268 RepID=A0ABY7RYG9_9FLAO|nr:YceI family protein [Psychroserpens ponticola]WCO01760.1 YceI family protein [Psychroserpens ponticola]
MKKKKITLVLFTSFLLSVVGFSQDLVAKSSVAFKIKNLGFNVEGFFSEINIESNFSDDDISQWTLIGNVIVNSIRTNNEKRDVHLLKDDFFDVKTFPKIVLMATNFKKTSLNKYDVTFSLTIKETTKKITIPMLIINNKDALQLTCDFEINRRDFDVGGNSLVMSKTVKIAVSHTVKKQ